MNKTDKALVTYSVPPMRAVHWQVLENDPDDPPLTEAAVREWVEANQPGWSISKVIVNPTVAQLPAHLAASGSDYAPFADPSAP